MINEKKVNVIYNKDEKVMINADEFYTEQIINNYFTNAIKNAKEIEGKKEIKIEIKQKDNKTIISVFNTGENIKEEDLERIWKRFYKVDESRNRQNGGTGIGLALVKAIMERTGKKYGVENKENEYDGKSGLNLNLLDRIILAIKEKDIKLAFSR